MFSKDPHRIRGVLLSKLRGRNEDATSVPNAADLDHSHGARRTLWLAENVVMRPRLAVFALGFQASDLASSIHQQTYTSLFDSGSHPFFATESKYEVRNGSTL